MTTPSASSPGHVVDSSDHQERVSPELAALDAAMTATDDMGEWELFRRREAHAAILQRALEAAAPHIIAAERERIRRLAESRAVTLIRPGMGLGHDEGIRIVPLADFREILADPSVPAIPTEGTTS